MKPISVINSSNNIPPKLSIFNNQFIFMIRFNAAWPNK